VSALKDLPASWTDQFLALLSEADRIKLRRDFFPDRAVFPVAVFLNISAPGF